MQPPIQDTPETLVEDGAIHSGFFKTPFRHVNLLDAKNFGGPLARPLRWLRLKEWVGFGICHPQLYGGMLIQNAKIAGSGTVYLYERTSKRKYEWQVVDLPHRARLPETLWHGESRCGREGNQIHFVHDLERGRHEARFNLAARGDAPALSVNLILHQDLKTVDPLVVSLPIAPDHHTYTHKSPLRFEGTITVGKTVYQFDPARDLGNLDEQKTFYPYRSKWMWGSFAAHSVGGRAIMLNFVDQMTPKGEPGEDAMWVDGKLMLIDQPDIIPLAQPGAYRIEDGEGRVKLTFTPEGSKAEKLNYGIAALDYEQYFGRYDGEVVDNTGGRHAINQAFGALERMVARF